ncbi:lytic transglycosylase domain-containing protein [Xanthomonas euvesicatoria pv. euvesicatoria]|uniref:lytic transglycosylase domain-containing protein n=1 Tax=Xanthomonas TaxID=338 RepID=UPI00093821CE|nr:lytic transglycosylase domain-containing protein [Xanthomonas euvesicatoria]APO88773.1 lytic transglycosylase [Xanthomonas euvesicatoria]MCC8514217.1 lytic transglycosylase domain-containing protein [Xanthomonas euvesicatoria pv. euvesicatoria]MCC8547963.1 lytic transglycosylase domain-containing protein [Xanthomonas euvesicatoria pv. euvesicatoria]MCC8612042.1 lytic transglycosylase domain-containing protein [Xanthomonas euvesicatoria pv. euvesicatoria]
MLLKRVGVAVGLLAAAHMAHASVTAGVVAVPACVVQAANDYTLPVRGLLAVWLTEGGRIGTVSRNKNGTADYGPMQINTVWAQRLESQFGVTRQMITDDFCWSVRAGAYILRYEINQAGGSFWDGVGHYHSRTPQFKYQYIERVYRNSLKF